MSKFIELIEQDYPANMKGDKVMVNIANIKSFRSVILKDIYPSESIPKGGVHITFIDGSSNYYTEDYATLQGKVK